LKKYLPVTYLTFFAATLAISGIPPFAGFFSKDEILANAFAHNPLVWGVAMLASLLTVFYMFRLFYLTFYGSARAEHVIMSHIHESPKSMTIPLMVLALLSFAGGFMNVPEALGGSTRLEIYLAPVFNTPGITAVHHLDHSTEYMLMGIVVGLTLIVIGLAYMRFVKKKQVPLEDAQLAGISKALYHKYYVDEIYDFLIVKPLHWFSKIGDTVVEKLAIDRIVNSVGQLVIAGSQVLRRFQTGSIGFYIFVMVLSIIVILTLTTVTEIGK
jgi:NADH-quinone oxidoreductase subunit L